MIYQLVNRLVQTFPSIHFFKLMIMHRKKTNNAISFQKKQNAYFFFDHYCYMVAQIRINEWMKKEVCDGEKSILFFRSQNNIHCNKSCVVDHHTTSSSSSIELHKRIYVLKMSFSYSVSHCFLLLLLIPWLFLLYYCNVRKKGLACCHSFTHLTLVETT